MRERYLRINVWRKTINGSAEVGLATASISLEEINFKLKEIIDVNKAHRNVT